VKTEVTSPQLLNRWARKIKQAGLTTPAILALETHKPLSFVMSQFLLVGQPALDMVLPKSISQNAISLFSNRANQERFIRELEEK